MSEKSKTFQELEAEDQVIKAETDRMLRILADTRPSFVEVLSRKLRRWWRSTMRDE